ncbi:hypothetical protein KAR91_32310 [Candidatus Pacearchaeota archaeon]|nr:hypothetical protein [Candidatus Pacearchaeota archaeon]
MFGASTFIKLLIIAAILFSASGMVCYSENPYITKMRIALSLESGCTIRKSYRR